MSAPPRVDRKVGKDAEWLQQLARWAHIPEVEGANPSSATKTKKGGAMKYWNKSTQIRKEMMDRNWERKDLKKILGLKSDSTVTSRLLGKTPWTVPEAFAMMKEFGWSAEEAFRYTYER